MSDRMHMVNSFDPTSGTVMDPVQRDLLARRQVVLGAPYRLFYEKPVHFVRGEGVLLFDADGADYLDAYNNVPVVGHSNSRVQQAVTIQLGILNTHTRYLTDGVIDYAERLVSLFPAGLDQAIFACTGSEAVDLAVRIARQCTGGEGVIITSNAYHGTTSAAAELSPSLGPNNPIPPRVITIEPPRSASERTDVGDTGFAERVEEAVTEFGRRGIRFAGMIIDSVMSSDGLRTDPMGGFSLGIDVVKRHGGIYIADEVQPGFGRTGDWWGFERYGVLPDLVVLGKPMGNGIPISAVVGTAPIFDRFGSEVRYFNTFGGNPVSVAAAAAVLDEITDRELRRSARSIGKRLHEELTTLAAIDAGVGEVRGAGLFLALDLISAAGDPDRERAARIVNDLRERRILISASGAHGNILKIRPPLVFGAADADRLLDGLSQALSKSR